MCYAIQSFEKSLTPWRLGVGEGDKWKRDEKGKQGEKETEELLSLL